MDNSRYRIAIALIPGMLISLAFLGFLHWIIGTPDIDTDSHKGQTTLTLYHFSDTVSDQPLSEKNQPQEPENNPTKMESVESVLSTKRPIPPQKSIADKTVVTKRSIDKTFIKKPATDLLPKPSIRGDLVPQSETDTENQAETNHRPPSKSLQVLTSISSEASGNSLTSTSSNVNTQANPLSVQPLKVIKVVKPKYPRLAKRRGIEGWVTVGFLVTEEGTVEVAVVKEGQPRGTFDSVAINAIKQFRFSPYRINGKPASQFSSWKFLFKLN